MNSNTGLTYFAVCLAVVAALLGVGGLWSASSADGHAKTVDARVDKVVVGHNEFAKATGERFNTVSVALAAQATSIVVLNNAVAKLQTKAEQSVLEKVAKELRDGKADKWIVSDLASQLLKKADAKTVRLLSRRMNRFDTRLVAVEDLVLPKVMNPPPSVELVPEVIRKATLPAGEAIQAEAARINAINPPTSAKSPAPPAK